MHDLEKLEKKISKYKSEKVDAQKSNDKKFNALHISAEIVSAVVVGVIIGAMLDKFFHTAFTFKLICLILSSIGVFINIYRNK